MAENTQRAQHATVFIVQEDWGFERRLFSVI